MLLFRFDMGRGATSSGGGSTSSMSPEFSTTGLWYFGLSFVKSMFEKCKKRSEPKNVKAVPTRIMKIGKSNFSTSNKNLFSNDKATFNVIQVIEAMAGFSNC
eukprot:TRINITY_DN12335_c0_g1_i3.p1 TRINITY_DN12335_c0_g1~~TRINITY_DN12335_c0_g1_i3.p1  ORF type:complete len:102 (+),score=8.40 TRINITY_DN12335_c0_g1_i3:200-505(+)